MEPRLCRGHGLPTVMRQVKKDNANKGRCAAPLFSPQIGICSACTTALSELLPRLPDLSVLYLQPSHACSLLHLLFTALQNLTISHLPARLDATASTYSLTHSHPCSQTFRHLQDCLRTCAAIDLHICTSKLHLCAHDKHAVTFGCFTLQVVLCLQPGHSLSRLPGLGSLWACPSCPPHPLESPPLLPEPHELPGGCVRSP